MQSKLSSKILIPALLRYFADAGALKTVGTRTFVNIGIGWVFAEASIHDGQLRHVFVILYNADVCDVAQGTDKDVADVLLEMLCHKNESAAVDHLRSLQS